MCLSAIAMVAFLAAGQPHEVVLFDFDSGIEGWWGNPWGGGKCAVSPAPDPKFGRGALRVSFENVDRGANGVSPYLDVDADWQKQRWDYVSFYVRGPGFPFQVRFAIEAVSPEGEAISYSRYFDVADKRWTRVLIPASSMFRRHDVSFSQARIKRLLFGGAGTGYYDVDAVALQAPTHFLPLSPLIPPGPAPLLPRLEHFPDDSYELCIDPSLFPATDVHVEFQVTWPGEKPLNYATWLKPAQAKSEVRLRLPDSPAVAGDGKLDLTVRGDGGATMFRGQYSFPVAFGQQGRPPTKWQVIPQPKSLVFHALYCRPAPEQGWRRGAPGYFEIERLADREDGVAEKIVGVGERECSEALQPATIFGAYVLDVSPARWLLRGRGNVGLVWAEQTLDHLRMSERLLSGQDRVPCVEVRDAPSLPIRAVSLSLPTTRWGYPNDAPVSPNFFQDFLDRVVVASKLNFVVLIVDQGMQLSTHPEVQGPAAWSQQVVAQIVGHLREQGIEVVPCLNSLGHAVWVTASHPELREDGDPQTLCTSHPNSRKIIGEIYDEVLRVFQPRYFHIGMDEVRWQTLNVPERQRCPLCAGKTKADVFAEQVKWLHGFMAERGVKTMMWGDMLLPAHNGGPPFEVAQAIDRIPKDIVICNWSCAVDPLSLWYFRSRGFSEVIKSNSLGASPADTPFIKGNMYGCWAKLPWLVESPLGYSAYNFLSILQAADYSWNLHPDVFTPSIDLDPAFFVERRLALARLVLSSCRDAAEIHGWATKLAGRKLSDVPAVPAAGQVLSAADIGASSGRWLVLVAAFRCSEKQLAELRERLKDKVNWLGAPAATVKFSYVDGQTAEAALRFGYHFRATGSPGLPFVYGAYALNDAPMWYAIPIENPRPTAALRAVSLVPDTAAADVHLSAVRLFKE